MTTESMFQNKQNSEEVFPCLGLNYVTFKEDLCSEDGISYCGYGIAVDKNGIELMRISDISTDQITIERLAASLNQLQVSDCHFADVVLDFISM